MSAVALNSNALDHLARMDRRMVPNDWDIVVGGGHRAYFNAQMRGRPAERYTMVREFGAVGNGLSYALGVAAARRRGARARSCCSKATAGSCSISRSSF